MHRVYENDDIVVFWDSEKCRHARKCVEGSPETFNPLNKPWINLNKADTAEIWQAVSACPSGALSCVYSHGIRVVYDEAGCRSVAYDGDREIGEPEYGGKGIAKRLVYRLAEEAERRKTDTVPTCSYAVKVLSR